MYSTKLANGLLTIQRNGCNVLRVCDQNWQFANALCECSTNWSTGVWPKVVAKRGRSKLAKADR